LTELFGADNVLYSSALCARPTGNGPADDSAWSVPLFSLMPIVRDISFGAIWPVKVADIAVRQTLTMFFSNLRYFLYEQVTYHRYMAFGQKELGILQDCARHDA
jgi:hypothetical protein